MQRFQMRSTKIFRSKLYANKWQQPERFSAPASLENARYAKRYMP